MDDNGVLTVLWSEPTGGGPNLLWVVNGWPDGGWTVPFELDDGGVGDSALAVGPAGDTLVGWFGASGYNTVFGAVPDGGAWNITALDPSNLGKVTLNAAIDGSGKGILDWVRSNGSTYEVLAQPMNNGVWGSSSLLNDPDAGRGSVPDVRRVCLWSARGRFWAALVPAAGAEIILAAYDGGTWAPPLRADSAPSYIGAYHPNLAFDNAGAGVLAWVENSIELDPFSSVFNLLGPTGFAGTTAQSETPGVAVTPSGVKWVLYRDGTSVLPNGDRPAP